MTIRTARRGKGARWGARKYATVASASRAGVTHKVVKFRVRGTRNYHYACTCEDHLYRQRPCKHIKDFKAQEARTR